MLNLANPQYEPKFSAASVLQLFWQRLFAKDYSGVLEILHPDFELLGRYIGHLDRNQLLGHYFAFQRAVPDMTLTLSFLTEAPHETTARMVVSGNHAGTMHLPNMAPLPATHQPVTFGMVARVAVREGRMVRVNMIAPDEELFAQVPQELQQHLQAGPTQPMVGSLAAS
jgi:hypothetical protein